MVGVINKMLDDNMWSPLHFYKINDLDIGFSQMLRAVKNTDLGISFICKMIQYTIQSSGGSRISQGGANLLFDIIFAKNFIKMKKNLLRGE